MQDPLSAVMFELARQQPGTSQVRLLSISRETNITLNLFYPCYYGRREPTGVQHLPPALKTRAIYLYIQLQGSFSVISLTKVAEAFTLSEPTNSGFKSLVITSSFIVRIGISYYLSFNLIKLRRRLVFVVR
ncbi:hypothetical protein L798_13052 [Zootermopsis nevadensis]|uniref:Uncharacterized protein n=1 Tax=Zootermopsis nevadensis TaxID=136037 RepID=A0A067QSB0_ZOONE|nr:hypothetical protein L798_13052 [Zootermopsis nevadensis]